MWNGELISKRVLICYNVCPLFGVSPVGGDSILQFQPTKFGSQVLCTTLTLSFSVVK